MQSEQLEKEIRKNKNLLQSNFALMQENENYGQALAKLRQEFELNAGHDENVHADDAQEFVQQLINKYKQLLQESMNARVKVCQCEKWKDLYAKESEQSYRLAERVTENQMRMREMEMKIEADRKEMQTILTQYLEMFEQVHCEDFFLQRNSQNIKNLANKQMKGSLIVQNHSSSKQKKNHSKIHKNSVTDRSSNNSRSKSKHNSRNAPSTAKKHNNNNNNDPSGNQQRTNACDQISMFPNFVTYLERMTSQISHLSEEVRMLRENAIEKQNLIRLYRKKERDRLIAV